MISCTDSVAVPLVDDVTTAKNVSDKPVYPHLISCLSSETQKRVHYIVADPGHHDQKMHDLSMAKGFQLVCPFRRYKNTPEERLKLVDFYQSALGPVIYFKSRISVQPLIEHIKSVFRIDPVPVRKYDKERNILLLSVLLYQIPVYYNYKTRKDSPKRSIEYMMGCWCISGHNC